MKIPRRRLTLSDYYLILANLVPLYGVLFLQWSAWEVFAVYTLETIIVGLLTVVKLGMAAVVKKRDTWENNGSQTTVSGLFFILFFLVHFGLFAGIQMSIFFSISGFLEKKGASLLNFLLQPHLYLSKEALLMLVIFAVGYGSKLLWDFVRSGKHRTTPMLVLMFEPYGRIFIQQFTVIAGSFVLLFGAGKVFVLVFTVAKIYVSVIINFEGYIGKVMRKRNLTTTTAHTRDTVLKD